jgi:N-formylmaleamate deformylase
MSSWSNGQVITNGVTLHYYRTGGDKPPVVLLHGFTDSGLCWKPVARVLEQDYDVVMIDARGHGLSSGPDTGFDTEILAEDALNVMLELKLQNPHLLGHSMGAHTAALVAKHHPDIVRSLLLEDPPWQGLDLLPATEQDKKFMPAWEEQMRMLKAQSPVERMMVARAENPRWSEEELIAWAESKAQFDLDVFKKGSSLTQRKWQVIAQNISCPTLLITGDPSLGALVTPETAHLAISTMQNGKISHISGAGHNIRRDQYTQFIMAVTTFLQQHTTL